MSNIAVGSNGGFVVNGGTEVSLGTLLMQLNIDRTKTLDSQIADQMSEIQERNEKLRALNDFLASLRQTRETTGKDNRLKVDNDAGGQAIGLGIKDENGNEIKKNIDGWFDYFGLTVTNLDPYAKDAEWQSQVDANIEAVKGYIDTLNSDSQLDMIRLQSLIDKRSVAFETASKHQDREYQDKSKINQKG